MSVFRRGPWRKLHEDLSHRWDAGWRVFSFLKIETDAGVIGWSEYN